MVLSAILAPSAPAQSTGSLASVTANDLSLLNKIRSATPSVQSDRSAAMAFLDVSGTVKNASGEPVADAIVLLRESSTTRISSETSFAESEKALHLRQVSDVLAKTKTDEEGHYIFRDVAAPGFKRSTTRPWRGDVVAAHAQIGVGYTNLIGKNQRRQRFDGTSIALRPTNSIEGRLVTVDQTPIANAIVSVWQLVEPRTDRFSPAKNMDLQASQLTPRTKTDAEGRFRFDQIPKSMLASIWVYDPDSAGANAAIKTSDEVVVDPNEASPFLRGVSVMTSPATIVADPGVMVSGKVLDEEGHPIADAKIHLGSYVQRFTTDTNGLAEFRIPKSLLERQKRRPAPNGVPSIRATVFSDDERTFLQSVMQIPIEDLESQKVFQVTLAKGIRVSGKVIDDQGMPLDKVGVTVNSGVPVVAGQSDSEGEFEVKLPAGKHVLLFFSDRDDLRLPDRAAIRVPKGDESDGYLKQSVELANGQPHRLETVVIPKNTPLQIIASLPDGSPAKDANVIIREEQTRKLGSFGSVRTIVVEKSAAKLTNSIGRVEVFPKGILSDSAWVDVSMTKSDTAFKATAKVSEANAGVLPVVLSAAPILEGRVLIDGKGVAGAQVSVGESREVRQKTSRGMINSFTTSNQQIAVTDADGYYRVAISRNMRYSVFLQSIPGESHRPSIGFNASSSDGGVVKVKDYELYRGTEELAGKVVDADGAPIAEASVQIMRDAGTNPSLWIGHYANSQMVTDERGRFRLSRVPAGNYRIRVSSKRSPDRTIRPTSTLASGQTGDKDLVIRLVGAASRKPLPRLKPIRIETITPIQ